MNAVLDSRRVMVGHTQDHYPCVAMATGHFDVKSPTEQIFHLFPTLGHDMDYHNSLGLKNRNFHTSEAVWLVIK